MLNPKQEFLIALGANQPSRYGGPAETLRAALAVLADDDLVVAQVSRLFQTPCFPAGTGPDYVNAAAKVMFEGTADALLDRLHRVEADFGRTRKERWGARVLDLDMIAAGDLVTPSEEEQDFWRALPPESQTVLVPEALILPHPRLQDRGFVLVPLADLAPDWVHPRLGLSVLQMLETLGPAARAEVLPLTEASSGPSTADQPV